MTEYQPFVMERMMSKFEQDVDFNLSESGVHPIILKELLDDDPGQMDALMNMDLNYPYVNGTPELRDNIARLYNCASQENILRVPGLGTGYAREG